MRKIIDWFKESNRYLHLLLGVVVGLLPTGWWNTEVLAAGVGNETGRAGDGYVRITRLS